MIWVSHGLIAPWETSPENAQSLEGRFVVA